MSKSALPSKFEGYDEFLSELKEQIRHRQIKAAVAVNTELNLLYWRIGHDILERQQTQGWGQAVVEKLSVDLRRAFPDMKGFSSRNLNYMRSFAQAWPDEEIVQQLVAQIPWGHNLRLLDRLETRELREWYARKTLENGWSRAILDHQLESELHARLGQAQTNFDLTLPAPQSDLARDLLKDPYNFDFLTLGEQARERDLERGLLKHLRDFLLELGVGFAFVGSQYRLNVAGDDFYVDMLFYHLKLRSFVVIDLKMEAFQPEFAGKMNFYLSAIDEQLRRDGDDASIGLVLCKAKGNPLVVEYALRGVSQPMGVSNFELTKALPDDLKPSLPTVEDLEAELGGDES